MTEQTGFPDPAANRAQWLADHPGAQEVTQQEAAGQVAAQIGAGAPDAGVTQADLAAQMAAAGAHAGLPAEDAQNAEMERLKAAFEDLSQQVDLIQRQRQAERQAAIAALGEPILQRYANGIRDKLKAHLAANPGLGPDHFAGVIGDAENLAKASASAISQGANDLGQVMYHAAKLDRWLSKTHPRLAPSHLKHLDLGSVGQDLEYLLEEADRLAPGALALA